DYPGKEKDIGIVTQKMRNGITAVENLERAAKQLDQYSWEELSFDKALEVTKHLPPNVLQILDELWLIERGLAHVNSNIDFIGRISINGQDQSRDYYYKNLSAFYAAQVELLHHGESITARQLLTMDAEGATDALGGRIAFNQSAGQILKDVEAGFAHGIDPQHGSRDAINRFATQKHSPTAPSAIDKLEEDVNRGIGEVGENVEAKAITGCDPDSDVINTPTAQDYKEIQDWGHEL
ncbi:hypothetical protein, partial [Eubacterium aggregans]|uniref:hypothetical protein n=1 Tax=Eubacterium aggregans TaxID=81409 RepID=UPI003F3BD432